MHCAGESWIETVGSEILVGMSVDIFTKENIDLSWSRSSWLSSSCGCQDRTQVDECRRLHRECE